MPKPPERPRSPEQQQPYFLASRFPTKQAAEQPYLAVQKAIHDVECDLSAYRFMRQWHEPNNHPWYVLVIGEKPELALEQRLTAELSRGDMASVPPEALEQLYSRRLEEIQRGSWREHHYQITVQRRNPKKDKLKRKEQKQSRRRNRGK